MPLVSPCTVTTTRISPGSPSTLSSCRSFGRLCFRACAHTQNGEVKRGVWLLCLGAVLLHLVVDASKRHSESRRPFIEWRGNDTPSFPRQDLCDVAEGCEHVTVFSLVTGPSCNQIGKVGVCGGDEGIEEAVGRALRRSSAFRAPLVPVQGLALFQEPLGNSVKTRRVRRGFWWSYGRGRSLLGHGRCHLAGG